MFVIYDEHFPIREEVLSKRASSYPGLISGGTSVRRRYTSLIAAIIRQYDRQRYKQQTW